MRHLHTVFIVSSSLTSTTKFFSEGYLGWAQHCLENRWTAEAVGVRFYQPSSRQYANVAQMVEQRIENPCVTSSTLVIGTKYTQLAQW